MNDAQPAATATNPVATWIDRILRFALAGVLAWAGCAKLMYLAAFAKTVAEFGLVFDPLARPIAVLLPIAELVAAVLLVADVRGGRLSALGLSLLFVLVTGYGLWLGLDIDCGCFGPGDSPGRGGDLRLALARSLAMAAASAYLYACPRRAPMPARG